VRTWDPATSTQLAALEGHTDSVNALCAYTQDGQPRLASGDGHDIGGDGTVRVWDPATGTQLAALEGHVGPVNALCAYTQDGQLQLASAGDDRTVRIWDPASAGQIVLVIPVYHRVLALTYETGLLCLGLSGGMLAIQV